MEFARCLANDKVYDAYSFSLLDEETLEYLRSRLACTECSAPAYFRRKSRDNKAACFGATHKPGCESANSHKSDSIRQRANMEVALLKEAKGDIAINFAPPRKPSTTSAPKGKGARGPSKENTERSLRALLRLLAKSDSFASSELPIHTGGKHPFKAKNLFVNFADMDDNHIDLWRGYWGTISHADKDLTWLNTLSPERVSIPISKLKGKETFLEACGIIDPEDIEGADALVFGHLKISENGKWFIRITRNDPGHIFIKPLSDD